MNTLNQITSRTVPGYVNVIGTATNTATVSLWGDNGQYAGTSRKGAYFRGELSVDNHAGPVWLTVTNLAVLQNGSNPDIITNTVGKMFIPKTAESFGYDLDGNLTNDGRWAYTWDAENRVTSFTRNSAAPSGSKVKLDCQYDSKSRRTQKVVSTWNTSTLNYQPSTTNRFIYDGWNLIAILDATNGLVQTFTWGTDASGTLQGAGGVGGLISMTVHQGTNAGTYFYCFDGNHNVTTLVNATNGAIAAQYEYASFGELLRATGPLAFANPFRFSTKYQDDDTGFLYYGYRYYDPSTGRWLSRDPLGEQGGKNVYAAFENDALSSCDALGLSTFGLTFSSEGRAFFDGNLLGSTRSRNQSGLRYDPLAWFENAASQISGCTGGICNSTTDRPEHEDSSFVTASVKNVSKCTQTVDCSCRLYYFGMTAIPKSAPIGKPKSLGGFTVKGHVLGEKLSSMLKGKNVSYIKHSPEDIGAEWVAVGSGNHTAAKTFTLSPGASKELYEGHIIVALGPLLNGSRFYEAMTGDCVCTATPAK